MDTGSKSPLRRAVERMSAPVDGRVGLIPIEGIIEQEIALTLREASARGTTELYPGLEKLELLLGFLKESVAGPNCGYSPVGFLLVQLQLVRGSMVLAEQKGDIDAKRACLSLGCLVAALLSSLGTNVIDFQLPPEADAA